MAEGTRDIGEKCINKGLTILAFRVQSSPQTYEFRVSVDDRGPRNAVGEVVPGVCVCVCACVCVCVYVCLSCILSFSLSFPHSLGSRN